MDNYVVYFFLGKAPNEERKISQWAQWQQCVSALDPLFAPYAKSTRIKSYQIFAIPAKKPRGNVTYKKVPNLAGLRWTLEDNRLWSDYSNANVEPYRAMHYETLIVSSKGKEDPDICIFVDDHFPAGMAEYLHNQNVTVSVNERVHARMPADYWDSMVAAISLAVNAVRVGRALRPWSVRKIDQRSDLDLPMFSRPVTQSIEFSDFFQVWEYLR